MQTTNDPSATLGAALAGDPAVQASIEAILDRLRTAQGEITEARPPDSEHVESYEALLARAGEVRGRQSLYPYLGTGLGNGPLVQLADGSVKWDLINGIGVHMFGHSHPGMVRAALESALSDVVMQGNLQFNADAIQIAELLVEEASRDSALRHCFLTNSGAMSNENALKVCQQKTGGAPRVIAFADCFMGRTTTMAQIGDSAGGRGGIPLNTHVDYMPYWDPNLGERSIDHAVWHLDQVIKRYPGQHSCFVFELTQGEGGFVVAPREFFVPLMERCREAGIPVWADEVQTFGRTDSMFRFSGLDLGQYVDVATVGKMSQICATLYTEDMNPKPGLLSGTFISSTSAIHVGLAALRTLRDGDYYGPDGRNNRLQAAYREHAGRFVDAHPEWFTPVVDSLGRSSTNYVEGTGGMMRLTPFGGDRARIMSLCHHLFREGVIAFLCGHGPYHLRFLAPVGVMQPEQFGPVFEIMERAFAAEASAG